MAHCEAFGLKVIARLTFIAVGLIAGFALVVVLPAVQVCRDWAFIDRNTGSRKGHRDWSLGWRTGSWYRTSALEVFMRSNHPAELQQQWVSYAGTGRNIFGAAMLHGHGRPGPIFLLRPEAIDGYCQAISQDAKRRLYDVLGSGEEAEIREVVEQINQTSVPSGKTEPATRSNSP